MKSLKARLILMFTVVIFIICAGLGMISIQQVSKSESENTYRDLEEMAVTVSKYMKTSRDAELQYVDSLTQNPIIWDQKVSMQQKAAFCEAEAKRTGYQTFVLIDKNGNGTELNNKLSKSNFSDRDYVQKALKGEVVSSDIIISKLTGKPVISFAAPVYSNGQQIGVLLGAKDASALSEMTGDIKYKETGYAYMINNQGVSIADKDIELVLRQENVIEEAKTDKSLERIAELTKTMIKREVGSGNYDYKGAEYVAGFAPVEGSPWIVVVEIEQQELLKEINSLRNLLAILCLFAIIVGAVITYFVSSSIVKPIKKVTKAAQEIADGNFNVELSVKSRDEVGQLASSFNLTIEKLQDYQGYIDEISDALMSLSKGDLVIDLHRNYVGQFKKLKDNMEALLNNLNSTLLQINQSADQVASGSDQVASGSQALSQGATEQASAIEELSASIAEITDQIKQNAENSKLASDSAEFAGKELTSSTEQMNEMISAMDQITAKSSEISKIIKIIDDIAFQTNILALNAAVEAARAGAAGKGFAVVADEVRNLAAKSAEAAKNTTNLIDETLEAVKNGSGMASKTADSLESSAKVAKKAVSIIEKIAVASNEQASSIAQVNQGVEQISAVVQTNAATAEESAAASEELSSQSNLLKQLISKFKLKETDYAPYSRFESDNNMDYSDETYVGSHGDKY